MDTGRDEDIRMLIQILGVQVEALLAQFEEHVELVELLVTEGRPPASFGMKPQGDFEDERCAVRIRTCRQVPRGS